MRTPVIAQRKAKISEPKKHIGLGLKQKAAILNEHSVEEFFNDQLNENVMSEAKR